MYAHEQGVATLEATETSSSNAPSKSFSKVGHDGLYVSGTQCLRHALSPCARHGGGSFIPHPSWAVAQ